MKVILLKFVELSILFLDLTQLRLAARIEEVQNLASSNFLVLNMDNLKITFTKSKTN